MTASRTRVLVETALTVALCAALHYARLWQMPLGGTVSLEMLPILVLAVRRGLLAGLTGGVLFGAVDFLLEPYFVHWAQIFLDYPIAFAAVGLAGLWSPVWRRLAGAGMARAVAWVLPAAVATGAVARYAAHFVSGVVFFATTAMGGPLANGTSSFASSRALGLAVGYSAVYNLYVPLSAAGCLAAMFVLMPTLERAIPTGDAE